MLPNFSSGIPYASDEPFHLARIMSLADALREGIFPVKVHPNLCYGLGYGVGFFYDNALIYFPAVLILAGVTLENAYKIFILGVFIAIAASMYYSCKRLTNNTVIASFAAAMYLLSNRIVGQLYVDFTIGNLCGAIFLPLAIAGIDIWVKEKKSRGMFIAGFTGLLYTHAITTLLAFSVCLLIAIVNIRTIVREKKIFIGLVLASVFVFLLSMAYWLPMWQQFHAQTYKSAAPWTTEEQNVVSISGLITDTRGIGILMVLTLFISIVFAIIIHSRVRTTWNERGKEILTFLLLGALYMVIPCIHVFWHLVNIRFTLIQFPARLFMPASVLVTFVFAIELTMITSGSSEAKASKGAIGICTALCLIGAIYICFAIYPNSFENADRKIIEEVEDYTIAGAGAGQEWLPIETNLDELKNNVDSAIAEDGSAVKGEKEDQNSRYSFQADLSHQYYDVPYIYYRGYIATDENGREYEVDKNPQNGLVRVLIPEQQTGNEIITVQYHDTKYAKFAYGVSLISMITGITYLFLKRRKDNLHLTKA